MNIRGGAIYGGHYSEVRNVIQIPFDDSIDSTHALECFFQMPTGTVKVTSAKVWVQRKSFRAYETATASESSHTHTVTIGTHSHGVSQNNSGGTTSTDSGHSHNYTDIYAATTSDAGGSSTPTSSGGAGHTHGITYGIYEQAAAGNLALYVADDGSSYGSAITSGVTSITAQEITPSLTKSSGDKRIKIEGTGLTRVQVLLMLDLLVQVEQLS